MRADRDRWREEVAILREELNRVIRGHRRMAELWKEVANECTGGKAAYALRHAAMFLAMASDAQRYLDAAEVRVRAIS